MTNESTLLSVASELSYLARSTYVSVEPSKWMKKRGNLEGVIGSLARAVLLIKAQDNTVPQKRSFARTATFFLEQGCCFLE
jgi:hypothetical protein